MYLIGGTDMFMTMLQEGSEARAWISDHDDLGLTVDAIRAIAQQLGIDELSIVREKNTLRVWAMPEPHPRHHFTWDGYLTLTEEVSA